MSTIDGSQMLALFEKRRGCCKELLELSRRQKSLIDSDDYQQLLEVLGRKQRILGQLGEINELHPNLQKQWQAGRSRMDANLRDDCEHVLAEIEVIMSELIDEEQSSTDFLIEKRDRTQRKLMAISQGSDVHDAYRTSLAPATHRHLDVGQ